MKSLIFSILATLVLIGAAFEAQADIILLETTDVEQPKHSETVGSIACNSNAQSCEVIITDFNPGFLSDFLEGLKSGEVVNMSFGYQRADEDINLQNHFESLQAQGLYVPDYVDIYEEREALFQSMIEDNSEVLFVAAAGNGSTLTPSLGANGVPVGPLYRIYPAIFEYDNLIKVTSANVESFNVHDRVEYQIPEYANYSTDYIDVAAPVEVYEEGTSFATPYVTRLADEINQALEHSISTKDLKEVLQKSCYIQSLETSLELVKNYKSEPRTSVIGRIQNIFLGYEERRKLIDSIKPVMLVKCGGVISSEVAKACANSFVKSAGEQTVTQACLEAQTAVFSLSQPEQFMLLEYWGLQGL